jgi:hypothetical protein
MHNTACCIVAGSGRDMRSFRTPAIILLACCALLLFCGSFVAAAQDQQPAAPAAPDQPQTTSPAKEMPPPPTAPSVGKALVYIYRVGRFTGSASHDHLYVNGVYLAYLKNGEYAGMEVGPGKVVVTGLPEMYTVDIFTAAGAAVNDATRKENERIRFEAEAGKTYYLKWTASTMATGIKVTLMDPAVGAREMSKLHLSKPVEQPNDKKKDATAATPNPTATPAQPSATPAQP